MRGESFTRTRSPGTRSGSVTPSVVWVITNIVGRARDQSLKITLLTRLGAEWCSVDGDLIIFFPVMYVGGLLFEDSGRYT